MQTSLRTIIIGALCLFINGCVVPVSTQSSSPEQQAYNQMDIELSVIGVKTKACLDNAWAKAPSLKDKLRSKNSIVADDDYIQNKEKNAFSKIIAEEGECRGNSFRQIAGSTAPYVRSFAAISSDATTLRKEVYDKYLNGQITTNQARSSLNNISDMLTTQWDTQYKIVVSELNQKQAQRQQNQTIMLQAINQGFQDHNQRQQDYQEAYNKQQQINKPVHTQCRWNAGVMDCTSYQY